MDMNLQLALYFSYFRLLWKFKPRNHIYPHLSPASSKNLFFFSSERTLSLAGWVQNSLSLISMSKANLGHGLHLGVSLSLLPGRFVAASSQGCASLLHQDALLSPRASKCFLSIPCEEGRVLWQWKFPWASNCYEGFCCNDCAAMYYVRF